MSSPKKEFAPGIPDKTKIHELPTVTENKTWEYAVHEHFADRRGHHFDLRLGDPSTGHAHSWALPPSLPKPGENIWVVQQPTHTVSYMNFTGEIKDGYGKGQVKLHARDKAEILNSSPGHITFTVYKGRGPEEFTLHRIFDEKWKLYNKTPTRSKLPEVPFKKDKYKEKTLDTLDPTDKSKVWSPKFDDAHSLFLLPKKGKIRAISYRPSVRSEHVIEHTHKLQGLHNTYAPTDLGNTILRGGIYAKSPSNRPIGANVLAGLLNSNVWKSREGQESAGKLKAVLYDVVKFKGKDLSTAPYAQKLEVLRQVADAIPAFELPEVAYTRNQKEKLRKAVLTGKHPETEEGLIEWDLNRSGVPTKIKKVQEHDVYIRNLFPGRGKYTDKAVGGFTYSHSPRGDIVGRVGTGFSDALRQDMAKNPGKYKGLVARVQAQTKYPTGALRGPSFKGFHLDKNPQDKLDRVKLSGVLDKIIHSPKLRKVVSAADIAATGAATVVPGGFAYLGVRHGIPLIQRIRALSKMGPVSILPRKKIGEVITPLQPHQQRVVDRMREGEFPGLVVAHGLGSGKTLSSLAVQDALKLPTTVIAPASLQTNYEKEIKKHVRGGKLPARLESLQRIARRKTPVSSPLMVLDEAHRVRNPESAGFKTLQHRKGGRNLLLTASPFYNHPSDIAPLIDLAAGGRVMPLRKKDFSDRYIKEKKIFPGVINTLLGVSPGVKPVLNRKREKELKYIFDKLVDYHANTTEGYPKVTRKTIPVPMSDPQLKVYDAMMKQGPYWIRRKIERGLPPSKQEARQLNAFANAIRQVSNTTSAFQPSEKAEEPKINSAFINFKKRLAKNPNAKALVYSNYLDSGIKPYKKRLEAAGIPYGEFTGEMKKKERDALVAKYNKGEIKALLVSSAGGEGLDLKGTRLIQILDPHWNNEKIKQVEGRGIRYKSHEHLPEKERHVDIQEYHAVRPPKGFFERRKWKKPAGSVDQYLNILSRDKENLIEEFKQLMQRTEEKKANFRHKKGGLVQGVTPRRGGLSTLLIARALGNALQRPGLDPMGRVARMAKRFPKAETALTKVINIAPPGSTLKRNALTAGQQATAGWFGGTAPVRRLTDIRGLPSFTSGVSQVRPTMQGAVTAGPKVKLGARAALKQIRRLVDKGNIAAASRIAKTPGVVKPTFAGSQMRILGRGNEGVATLRAHPDLGVVVGKTYDPKARLYSKEMIRRKDEIGAMNLPHIAKQYGNALPGRKGTFTSMHEYVPSGSPVDPFASQGLRAGKYNLSDLHSDNIRNVGSGRVKVIDYQPALSKEMIPGSPELTKLTKSFPNRNRPINARTSVLRDAFGPAPSSLWQRAKSSLGFKAASHATKRIRERSLMDPTSIDTMNKFLRRRSLPKMPLHHVLPDGSVMQLKPAGKRHTVATVLPRGAKPGGMALSSVLKGDKKVPDFMYKKAEEGYSDYFTPAGITATGVGTIAAAPYIQKGIQKLNPVNQELVGTAKKFLKPSRSPIKATLDYARDASMLTQNPVLQFGKRQLTGKDLMVGIRDNPVYRTLAKPMKWNPWDPKASMEHYVNFKKGPASAFHQMLIEIYPPKDAKAVFKKLTGTTMAGLRNMSREQQEALLSRATKHRLMPVVAKDVWSSFKRNLNSYSKVINPLMRVNRFFQGNPNRVRNLRRLGVGGVALGSGLAAVNYLKQKNN